MRERANAGLAALGFACIFGAAATVAISLVGATTAVQAAEPPALVAARYGGSDLTGGQSAWPPRGAPKAGATRPSWPVTEDDGAIRMPAPPTGDGAVADRFRVQAVQGAGQESAAPGGFISEIRLGVLAHDVGLLGRDRENGVDVAAELLFVAPGLLDLIGSPRPHIGVAVNTVGDTSQVYGGLTWDWNFWGPLYVEGTLGLAAHDGKLDTTISDRKSLGCRVLFRESVALGARFLDRHNISLIYSHISNAELCDKNDGLDTVGVTFGYVF